MSDTLIDRITVLRLRPGDVLVWATDTKPTTESLNHFQQSVTKCAGFPVPVWVAAGDTRLRVLRPKKDANHG